MAEGVVTPYSGVAPFFSASPGWVPAIEQERISAYAVYEQIYWNNPETFALVVRGTDAKPVYVPSAKVIIEATNRYVGKGISWSCLPGLGSDSDQANAQAAFDALFARERFVSTFNGNKRFSLIRGDMVFHVIGNLTKAPGSRIKIKAVDPASYFPVYASDLGPDYAALDPDTIVKVHIAETFTDVAGKAWVRRQTYERMFGPDGSATGIQSSLGLFETDPEKWFGKGNPLIAQSAAVQEVAPFMLPPDITTIPVYHVPNFNEPGNPYGASELRGIERVIAALNQTMSDEDLTLALDGIGVYATEGGAPVDENGDDTDWIIGPGRVIENAINFRRVEGVRSVQPFGDHIDRLMEFAKQANGVPDIAVGKVDAQVAESGVALQLQLGPMLAKVEEKNQGISDVLNQMFYDLCLMWFPAYESLRFGEAIMQVHFGDPVPQNRKAVIDEVVALMAGDPPVISVQTGREMLADRLGMVFPEDEAARIAAENGGAADPQGARIASELNAGSSGSTGN